MPLALILSQGDEVVTGQVVDSNAAWLAERLTEVGFDVLEHVSVRDVGAEIADQLHRASTRADVVVCTGGLGPTEDDLTAGAVASAFHRPLELDVVALAHIRDLYARYNRPMPAVNEKQAWLPKGAQRLDNDWGTAPGFAVREASCTLIFLPGVPREMKAMWAHRVAPLLTEQFQLTPGVLVTLKTTGIGESDLQERIGPFLEDDAILSYRTMLPENHIKLRFRTGTSEERIESLVRAIADRIGSPIFAMGRGNQRVGSLAETVAQALASSGQTLATAESCTGGLIASQLTAIPGASSWFIEGAVTYANEAKMRTLDVSEADLIAHGAVSEVVARQMARGMQRRAGTDFALSTTGVAGPSGGTDEKPVGLVHIALACPGERLHHRLLRLGGDRERIQSLAAGAALDLLRRELQSLI